jgi:hypothetical protein
LDSMGNLYSDFGLGPHPENERGLMKPIEVTIPPALLTLPSTGKRYIVSGDVWVEVPLQTTRSDLDKYVTLTSVSTPPQNVQTWEVEGSRGNLYKLTRTGEAWTCSCTGFAYRRRCRHIEATKDASR